MDAFDVLSVDATGWELPADGPTTSNLYRWEDDVVLHPGGSDPIGKAVFRGKVNGDSIKCKGWIRIKGEGGGHVLLKGTLTLVESGGRMKVGAGELERVAISSEPNGWNKVRVSVENPKRYTTT